MGDLLLSLTYNTTATLHPALSAAGERYVTRLANTLLEYDREDRPAGSVGDIAPARWTCRLGVERACEAMRLTRAQYRDGLADARAVGLVHSVYEKDSRTGVWSPQPYNTLRNPVVEAVRVAAARQQVLEHLAGRPLVPVHLRGTDLDKRLVDEVVKPATATAAVDALLRSVRLAYVGHLGRDAYPQWWPTGEETAALLYAAAAQYTGAVLEPVAPPRVVFRGSWVILSAELANLLPADLPHALRTGDAPAPTVTTAPPPLAPVRTTQRAPKAGRPSSDADVLARVAALRTGREVAA